MHVSRARSLACVAALGVLAINIQTAGQRQDTGVLDEHPAIQYASRRTTDRVATLNEELAQGRRSFRRDARAGFLLAVLEALGIPPESQLLVFSRTGVQRAYTSPRNPRALYFDQSVVVGYIPGAPLIEVAAHDRQQGVVFYILEQGAAEPAFKRGTSCLTCHVSASTLEVPGMLVRSHTVDADGNLLAHLGSEDVDHRTPHSERWGGWFVTADPAPVRYAQRAHAGNITFSRTGGTSNQAFIDWLDGSPDARGYPSATSDIVALLLFDHQMHAINLLTRLNWEARVCSRGGRTDLTDQTVRRLVNELAEYLLFHDEVPPVVPLTPRPALAQHLARKTPADREGRSFALLDLDRRLLRYPCSYMVYSEAFDALPADVRQAVYRRMIAVLASAGDPAADHRVSAEDRRAVLEILTDTKPDFPRPAR
jgi:hypothetical protein